MDWSGYIKDFESFLKLEKSLSPNSIEAYLGDIGKLVQHLEYRNIDLPPGKIELSHLENFLEWVAGLGMGARSQARLLSGVKAFFKYLLFADEIQSDPTALLEAPRIGRKLPEVLSIDEIDRLIAALDLSKPEGHRNKAMLETLYSCGLRVSELTGLRMTNLFFDQGFIRILGKGNKERLVPISGKAIKEISTYLNGYRNKLDVKKDSENIVFLNRRGRKLTRVMVFTIIKDLAKEIGLKKKISPHTFRHSFATHLIDGGADLRAVQEMLGHESITTTEIYTHLDREYLRDSIIQYHPRSK
ncbi:MAG: site-specific tyrosine recombinase XerD [Bacteroidetes bacterium]|nr:site-specific tyrosine recombinase XerD [Bacteroidota bacterium]